MQIAANLSACPKILKKWKKYKKKHKQDLWGAQQRVDWFLGKPRNTRLPQAKTASDSTDWLAQTNWPFGRPVATVRDLDMASEQGRQLRWLLDALSKPTTAAARGTFCNYSAFDLIMVMCSTEDNQQVHPPGNWHAQCSNNNGVHLQGRHMWSVSPQVKQSCWRNFILHLIAGNQGEPSISYVMYNIK